MVDLDPAEMEAAPRPPADVRPLGAVRRVVARRMTEAARTIPAVTLHRSAAVDGLMRLRDDVAERTGRKPAIDALIAQAVARTLRQFELLNGSWVDDPPAVLVHPQRNIAVAVDTAAGLTAVVLRSADERELGDLDTDLREMVERARSRRSRQVDLAGATFTITNLGGLSIEAFTPIITPPQAAVLGIGAIRVEPAGHVATLSLTFDHRIVDGADAARFLAALAEVLSNPLAV